MSLRRSLVVCLSLFALVPLTACVATEDGGDGEVSPEELRTSAGLKKGDVCDPDSRGTECKKGLACVDNCPDGAKCYVSIFTCQEVKKPPISVIRKGGHCQPDSTNAKCADGLVCADNCPEGAHCLISIFTCQPGAIEEGGICNERPGDKCASGLTCRDNCPSGAFCFRSIFTCQP